METIYLFPTLSSIIVQFFLDIKMCLVCLEPLYSTDTQGSLQNLCLLCKVHRIIEVGDGKDLLGHQVHPLTNWDFSLYYISSKFGSLLYNFSL